MARPPRFGPGRQPLLRQKKHARRLNKKTSVKIAGRVGTVISKTLPTVNINKGYIMHIYAKLIPSENCSLCNVENEYICFDCEHKFMKQNYPNYFYNDDCEWELTQGTSRKQQT